MSCTLRCPNCGAPVGEASREDGYINKFYYKNDEGEPYCKNCQSYDSSPGWMLPVIFFLFFQISIN